MYLFSKQFHFFCIPQGISFCSPPHTQVMAESTVHQVTLARSSICVKLCAKTLLLEWSNCSLSAFVLARGTATSCHVCYYRAKTGFPPLLQFTRQLLPLLPAAEWAWAVAFTQCACFPHVNPDMPLACNAPLPLGWRQDWQDLTCKPGSFIPWIKNTKPKC